MARILADITDTAYQKLKRLKEQQGFAERTWAEWLTDMGRNVNLDPMALERVHEGTRKTMLKLWMRNFADNLPFIREGQTIRELVPHNPETFPQGPALVLGRGPSIFTHSHLDLLEGLSDEIFLTASDGILPDMLEHDIIPDLVVTVDGSEALLRYYDTPIVRKYADKLKVAMVTQAHPKVVQTVRDAGIDLYWWLPMGDLPTGPESITAQEIYMTCSEKNPTGVPSQEAGGNAGSAAWVMTWALLRRSPIGLVGFDFGYPEGTDITQTYYYSTFLKYMDRDPLVSALKAESLYELVHHPIFKTTALVDPVFQGYREAFYRMLERCPSSVEVWNCTEGGCLWHDRLKCTRLVDFLENLKS